ncbi:MAG: SGNH/GDSL hydrolase family protein [Deltaproteobacteria bacterium]|nr:SGNH/GDSL hydrolase family protein [Deltaproteobacteria bacterium]
MIAFGLIATLLVLLGLNFGVEALEKLGLIETHRVDDYVQFLDEPLFRVEGDDYVTTDYAEGFLVPQRFARKKGDIYRVFVLGASFAMGTPYTVQSHGEERPGGIATWLREDFDRRLGAGNYEVINAAAGAQTSHRVRRIAEEVLQFEPDLLFVATCNNEGPPKPSYVREQLHQLGAYRLLTRLVAPPTEAEARPTFTPQMLAPERVRQEFEQNVAAILDAAGQQGVPVALGTLPLNLRYGGTGAPLPPGDEAGAHPEEPCVREGRQRFEAGDFEGALSALGACDGDVPDAARWTGLSLAALGRVEEARTALQLSIELLPRNRCRPSLNGVTRSLASERDWVHLIDLEAAAEASSPQGLPGPELFVDYCHLNWRGYHQMAAVLLERLEEVELVIATASPALDPEVAARRLRIPDDL